MWITKLDENSGCAKYGLVEVPGGPVRAQFQRTSVAQFCCCQCILRPAMPLRIAWRRWQRCRKPGPHDWRCEAHRMASRSSSFSRLRCYAIALQLALLAEIPTGSGGAKSGVVFVSRNILTLPPKLQYTDSNTAASRKTSARTVSTGTDSTT